MRFQNVVSHAFEWTDGTGLVHFQLLSILALFVLDRQVFDQIDFLRCFEGTKRAFVQSVVDVSLLMKFQAAFTFERLAALVADLGFFSLRQFVVGVRVSGQVLYVVALD